MTTGARDDERPTPVRIGPIGLEGLLTLPGAAKGVILFAHGSGSSRFSPRNTFVAEQFQGAGFGTVLFDLLTEEESLDRANVFDIPLLADRLLMARDWVADTVGPQPLPVGYFGSSTGAAAALIAAAQAPEGVAAVVSRGGRPDLAEAALPRVRCPTLLIVGGRDHQVLQLNRMAFERLGGGKDLQIVEGATHLFEEPGALDTVVDLAREWFARHLSSPSERTAP